MMNFRVNIGNVGGGYNGVFPFYFTEGVQKDSLQKWENDSQYVLQLIERQLEKEFIVKPTGNVGAKLYFGVERITNENGEEEYVIRKMYLQVFDNKYENYGRQVFTQCHKLFRFVAQRKRLRSAESIARRKERHRKHLEEKQKKWMSGWTTSSIDDFARSLKKFDRKHKR